MIFGRGNILISILSSSTSPLFENWQKAPA